MKECPGCGRTNPPFNHAKECPGLNPDKAPSQVIENEGMPRMRQDKPSFNHAKECPGLNPDKEEQGGSLL